MLGYKFELENLVKGRSVPKMKTSEAKKIVNDYWAKIYALTTGSRNPKRVERNGLRALKEAGFGYLA